MKKLGLFIFIFLVLGSGIAKADCTFGGKNYAEGATIPGYICKDGVWVPAG